MASRSPLSLGFKDFESALSTRGLAPTTQAAYLRSWKLLLGTCAVAGVEVGAVTPEQARGWWAAWTAGKGSSAHLQLKAGLGAGYRILGLSNPFESCEAAQIADRKIRYLTPQEVGQVLARLAENRADYLAALLYALSFTLFYTGKRYGDLVNLLWSDVQFQNGVAVIARLKTKGGKHEDCPLVAGVGKILKTFKETQVGVQALRLLGEGGVPFARSPYVFCSLNGYPLTSQLYNRSLAKVGRELRLSIRLSSHVWRHSLATYLLNVQRANLREVQDILGHSRLETTARYTHVTPEARRIILEQICLP